ncbi:hypothetical protein CJF42_08975 [Pseudoalteromonas sp. NBT06-2]|uniref:EAL domain-containing response regulator n=1 Tax=Pseudoalteromonas sp. NBT06-2 TaxID=2025950 RepID=UPI000BA50C4C|nr:EAL domain-containing response regulator [Pseudoalteromonas sp. NBT06-2]PAJ74687.1 hypothetical protein CJF42_08975 [Pseudoalteromonas sp. NBT06-2]
MDTLLLIDDDNEFAQFFCIAVESKGSQCQVLSHSKKIIDYELSGIDHIVIDLVMPDLDGLQILRFLKNVNYSGYISVTSGQDQSLLESAREICKLHELKFHSVLKKPFDLISIDNLFTTLPVKTLFKKKQKLNNVSDKEIAKQLPLAIKNQNLEVYFQPKINLVNSKVEGFEALARWQLNETYIEPTRFIALAESLGLIGQLTEVIVEKSLNSFSLLLQKVSDVSISINFSALDLSRNDLPDLLRSKIDKYRIPSELVTLEITETVFLQKSTLSLEVLTRLRLMGFKLSIDDFGTGYASVNMLQNGPFTELKIDRSFISGLHNNKQDRIIVQSIIQMANQLNISIVAEGIEDQNTLTQLLAMNCQIGQGYFFSRPMSHNETSIWLDNKLLKLNSTTT